MSGTETAAPHTDSISSQDPNNPDNKEKKSKSRRPANTAFRQQRLKAWQPILTPKTVLPLFFAIGIIFAPIGGLLLYASAQVQELIIDYSKCDTDAPLGAENAATMNSSLHSSSFKTSVNSSAGNPPTWYREQANITYRGGGVVDTPICVIQFHIPNDLSPPVLFYYQLTNFYQNHRRYVKSLNTNQLLGDFESNSSVKSSACDPLTNDHNGVAYYPCGLIANSLFNDTFSNPALLNPPDGHDGPETYLMENNSGIAWSSDKELYGKTKYTFDQVVPPPNWVKQYANGTYNSQEDLPDLEHMENFQVWMRTAGLPVFSKLYQRNDNTTMPSGDYRVNITMNFPVQEYGGKKKILISTRTVAGGKNPFLGIAYVVVAGICVVLGAIFTITHLIRPRKLGDHTYLTWNNEPPATATASGRDIRPGDA